MKKTILIMVNHEVVIYNFRKELVEVLLSNGHDVIISSPMGEKVQLLVEMGCKHSDISFDRHGINPIDEIKLIRHYRKIIRFHKPDVILTFTIKPNIYGSIAAKRMGIPVIANITGLGTAVENSGILQKGIISLYKYSFSKIAKVYFQNEENMSFFKKHKIAIGKHDLLPGSGVNLHEFSVMIYPPEGIIKFTFISRIMKEKGIDEYVEAARIIRNEFPNTEFHVCGFHDGDYAERIKKFHKEGIIIYHGMVSNVREILEFTHCTIHPSYYPEGMSNVLLESAASARPIITTQRSGCREVVDDRETGYLFKAQDTESLVETIKLFINLSNRRKYEMGLKGRKKMEKEFDRKIVVQSYVEAIDSLTSGYLK